MPSVYSPDQYAKLLTRLFRQLPAIRQKLSDDEWQLFWAGLLELIPQLAMLEDQHQALSEIRKLTHFPEEFALVEEIELSVFEGTVFEKSTHEAGVDLGEPEGMATLQRMIAQFEQTDPSSIGRDEFKTKSAAEERFLNAGFVDPSGKGVSEGQPLILNNGSYQLGVDIGEPWGPGSGKEGFPDLPDEVYEAGSIEVDLFVRSSTAGVTIEKPQRKLVLPQFGNSGREFFALQLAHPGRFAFQVDVFYQGHLLQSRVTEAEVLQTIEDPRFAPDKPVQDGGVTFTRTTHLSKEALKPLEDSPRRLTILPERSADTYHIDLHFYTHEGEKIGRQTTRLTESKLTKQLDGLQKRLQNTMEQYRGYVGSTEDVLAKHLGLLADAGHTLFRNLLDASDNLALRENLRAALEVSSTIQVAPLSPEISMPWELLYDRRIDYVDGETRLCTAFKNEDHIKHPQKCPHKDDPNVVCPHGFWGYRFVIEQLPFFKKPEDHAAGQRVLTQLLFNDRPLVLPTLVYGFKTLAEHLHMFQEIGAGQLQIETIDNLSEARLFFGEKCPSAALIYFFTHGGKNDMGAPYLQIADEAEITVNKLEAWMKEDLRQQQPLIILNACESADYNPNDFESLLHHLVEQGASGVIGTQCAVLEKLADAFMRAFFVRFLKETTVGESLFQARRDLLIDHLDPRGLMYSLFASADIKLAQPVI